MNSFYFGEVTYAKSVPAAFGSYLVGDICVNICVNIYINFCVWVILKQRSTFFHFRKAANSAKDIITMTNIPSTSVEEPTLNYRPIYDVVSKANKRDSVMEEDEYSDIMNDIDRPVYAEVTKGKEEESVMEDDGYSDIMNDVDIVRHGSSGAITCENEHFYETVR